MKKILLLLAAIGLLAGCRTSYSDNPGRGGTGDADTRMDTGNYSSPGSDQFNNPTGNPNDTEGRIYHGSTGPRTRMPEDPNNP